MRVIFHFVETSASGRDSGQKMSNPDYTKSVINIFKHAQMLKSTHSSSMNHTNMRKPCKPQEDDHTDCPQARFQRRTYSDAVRNNNYRVRNGRDYWKQKGGYMEKETMGYRLPTKEKDDHTDCQQARYQRQTYSDIVRNNSYRVGNDNVHKEQEFTDYRVPTNNRFAPLNY